jgi:hypothetical protein
MDDNGSWTTDVEGERDADEEEDEETPLRKLLATLDREEQLLRTLEAQLLQAALAEHVRAEFERRAAEQREHIAQLRSEIAQVQAAG